MDVTDIADTIHLVASNDYALYQTIEHLAHDHQNPGSFAYAYQDYFEDCIDAVLREVPPSMAGAMWIREFLMYLPISVFDHLADRMWDSHEWGNCDLWECGKRYDRGSREDHCPECGTCWEHCGESSHVNVYSA